MKEYICKKCRSVLNENGNIIRKKYLNSYRDSSGIFITSACTSCYKYEWNWVVFRYDPIYFMDISSKKAKLLFK